MQIVIYNTATLFLSTLFKIYKFSTMLTVLELSNPLVVGNRAMLLKQLVKGSMQMLISFPNFYTTQHLSTYITGFQLDKLITNLTTILNLLTLISFVSTD